MHGTTNSKPIQVLVIENNNDYWITIEKSIHSCFAEALVVRVASAEEALRSFERYYLGGMEDAKPDFTGLTFAHA